jgi:signal transduction histidine kinase
MFKEAVNNLVRHSGCSEAGIEFRVEAERLFLKVTDNGRGFAAQGNSNGHGLTSMRARTEGLDGTVEMVSDRGVGTTITFVIPMSPHDRTAIESET